VNPPDDLETAIAELAEMVRELRALDVNRRVFGSALHDHAPARPLPEAEIAAFEAAHGIRIPDDYRLYLRMVGEGGAGPYYGMTPLATAAQLGTPGGMFPFVAPAERGPAAEADGWAWDRNGQPYVTREALVDRWMDRGEPGVLQLCDQGCAIYSYLVVTGPHAGGVWDGSEVMYPLDETFVQWFRFWAERSLRRLRNLPVAARAQLGMTAEEVAVVLGGTWKESPGYDPGTFYLHSTADVPVHLLLDEARRVIRVTPWDSL
jgi:hypothetical protein